MRHYDDAQSRIDPSRRQPPSYLSHRTDTNQATAKTD
jgi:hypothetical protein